MGWWKIDPETGLPTKDTSKISEPGSVSLNAIPGIDDDPDACYSGDTPWDAVYQAMQVLREFLGEFAEFSEEEAGRLIFDRALPVWADPGLSPEVLRIIDTMWFEVDDCYEEDWGREAKPPEKRVAGEQAVVQLTREGDGED